MTTPYLQLEHTPLGREPDATDLVVRGQLPEGLQGTFVRNSADPVFPPSDRYHWFDGDGMVHGVHLAGGRASARSRWIRTAAFEAERAAGRPLWRGINERPLPDSPTLVKDTANTHLVVWNRQLLATVWLTGTPIALTCPDLATVGPGQGPTGPLPRMTAHPKVCPRTGELFFQAYDVLRPPYLTVGAVRPDGRVDVQPLDIPHPHIPHDLAITEHFVVLLDLPLGWNVENGKRRITFFRDRPTRIGLWPRSGGPVRWLEHDPCYVYHLVGAHEDGDGRVVITGCRIADPIPREPSTDPVTRLDTIELRSVLYRWIVDPRGGRIRGEPLDDVFTEFPRVDDRTWGRRLRTAYHPRVARRDALAFDGLIRYDLEEGRSSSVDWPAGFTSGEVVFAARPGGVDDDDGWLLTVRSSAAADVSELVVLDAHTLDELATVQIPWRVPHGFHAEWVAA